MNVSPYLMRRLRTLEEFLRAQGEDAALFAQQGGDALRLARNAGAAEGCGAKRERPRLTLVSSTDGPSPAR